ncbi:MAG: hypothetical protein C0404_11170, partial [Verrucomicrobia bacterium]|nr:hypothetical protein [Verrucomicrobiota bacterium]
MFPTFAFGGGAPAWVQEHYRWRNDDGNEAGATWKANADAAITGVTRGTNIRLRFDVLNSGTASGSLAAKLEYSLGAGGPWTAISPASDGLYAFEMTTSANYANGDATTALLTGTGTFTAGKAVESPSNTSAAVTINTNQYSNFEYCFRATTKAIGGSSYYFRVSGLNTYSQTAQLTMAPGEANEAPVIRSALTANASCAAAMSYQIQASGSEPITYGASGLPGGLSFVAGNMITGTPTVVGVFNVGLTATNAYGGDAKTLVLTTVANMPPTANNSSVTVASGGQVSCALSATDPEGRAMTYLLGAAPSHGAVGANPGSSSWIYYPAAGYAGSDSFQWQASDGVTNSNVATVSITVTPTAPVPQNQSTCVATNTLTVLPASYAGGGGYTLGLVKVAGPSHGSAAVSNLTFVYTPTAGYAGTDQISWYLTYGGTGVTATVTNSITVKAAVYGNDWPQWRYDEYRSAMTPVPLPGSLYLQWRRDFPSYATPGLLTKNMNDDFGYFQPVMAGTTVVVNVTGRDKVVGLDALSGAVKWTFYTDGPTRFAPAISNGRVYAPSDDGYLYCLDLETGALINRILAGGGNRKFFGQTRLISPWMVRGGPMVAGGKVFFASGLWALEGIFAFALNGATGAEIWRNDGLGGMITGQPHDGQPTVSGPSPQGYLCMKSDNSTLYVPGTEAEPALLNPSTGNVISWWQGGTYGSGLDSQGYKTMINGGQFVNLGPFSGTAGTIPIQITAGGRSYTASDASALGVSGTIRAILSGGNCLFVMTQQGSLYCFGGTQATPNSYTVQSTPLPVISDQWTANAAQILAGATAKEGCILVAGIGTERLVDELVKQAPANAIIVAIDPNANKVAALRATMDAAGYYGSRIAAYAGDPLTGGFPQYGARLVVSEDVTAAGYPSTGSGQAAQDFIANLYRVIMPYGGMAWLPLTGGQHTTFATEVAVAGLDFATAGRSDPLSTLTRTSLKNASNAKAGAAAYDKTVKGPLGFLWFHAANNTGGHGVNIANANNYNGVVNQSGTRSYVDAFSGLPLSSSTWDGTSGVVSSSSAGSYVNPFTGLPGPGRTIPGGYGCGSGFSGFGYISAGRAGTAGFHDALSDSGTVHIDGVRSCCGNPGGNVGSGVHYWDTPGCYCAYSVRASFALAPVPEVENWSRWGYGPTQDILDEKPIRLLGVNFGAPADQKAPDGKLWVGYPAKCGACPNVLIAASGPSLQSIYHHSSRIKNNALKFVASSVMQGATNVVVILSRSAVATQAIQAPAVDGVMSDSCWDGSRKLMLCNNSMPADIRPAYAWMRYDAANLYVAFSCPSGTWASGDSFNIYLSGRENIIPDSYYGYCGVNRYARFCVSTAGAKTEYLGYSQSPGGSEDGAWAGTWNAGVSAVNGQAFTAEMAIPWTTIKDAGLWDKNLIVNLAGPGYRRLRDLCDSGYWVASSVAPGQACKRFVPLNYDTVKGDLAMPLADCKVRLHFAETEGAAVGQRVFDVKLQGSTILSNFDIAQAALSAGSGQAGGQNWAVVQEVTLPAADVVNLDLVPKTGQTLISGIEIAGSYQERV